MGSVSVSVRSETTTVCWPGAVADAPTDWVTVNTWAAEDESVLVTEAIGPSPGIVKTRGAPEAGVIVMT